MNVGASSNIQQSIISFSFLVWKGGEGSGGREGEEEKGVWALFTFFPKCKKSLLVPGNRILHF